MLQALSFVINVFGNLEYVVGALKGKYRPERATWLIWTAILSITFLSYRSIGAEASLWFLAGDWLMTALIAVVALRFGVGGWNRLDLAMFGVSAIGLTVWLNFDAPVVALFCAMAADVAGAVPTLKKSLVDPLSESVVPYAASSLAALIGFYLVGQWSVTLLLYPFYLFVINLLIALTVFVGRYHLRRVSV